jgi:hypothetical protein
MTLLRTMTISMVMALLAVASQAGAQDATHEHQHGATPGPNVNMMGSDPAAMCASMMQSMMSDPVIHQRMNELMRQHMQPGNGTNRPMMPMSSASPEPTSH